MTGLFPKMKIKRFDTLGKNSIKISGRIKNFYISKLPKNIPTVENSLGPTGILVLRGTTLKVMVIINLKINFDNNRETQLISL